MNPAALSVDKASAPRTDAVFLSSGRFNCRQGHVPSGKATAEQEALTAMRNHLNIKKIKKTIWLREVLHSS